MSDGLRMALYGLSSFLAAVGLVLLLLSFVQSRLKTRVRETTPLRVLSIAILLLSAGVTLGLTAWIWPHPPQ